MVSQEEFEIAVGAAIEMLIPNIGESKLKLTDNFDDYTKWDKGKHKLVEELQKYVFEIQRLELDMDVDDYDIGWRAIARMDQSEYDDLLDCVVSTANAENTDIPW